MSVVTRERPLPSRDAEPLEVEQIERAVHRTWRTPAALAGFMTLPLLLGGQRLRTHYWLDEALTVGIASHPIASIPRVLLKDGSPPLYYLLLAIWTSVFGTSEVATHSLSLLIAVAIVPTSFWAADRLFGRRAAWFTAAFASLSPFVTYFAGETRMYSLVVLESLLVCVAFSAAFIDCRARGGVWFALSLAALAYTHYWALYAAMGALAAVVVLAFRASDRRPIMRNAWIGFGGAAALFLPWLPTFLSQLRSTGAPWSHTPTLRGVVGELAALVRDERVLIAVVLGVGVGLAPLIRDVLHDRSSASSRDVQRTFAILLIGVAPIAIGWTLAHLEPSWATRYLAVMVGPMILVVGLGLSRARWLGIGALLVIALLVTQPFTRISPGIGVARDSKSNAGSVMPLVKPQLTEGSLVLVSQPEAVPLVEHYLGGGYRYADPRGLVDDPRVMDWRDAEDALSATSVPGPLRPQFDGLRPGSRMLLVSPAWGQRDTDTSWINRFRTLDRQWRAFLEQTCLEPISRARHADGPSDTPYEATLYECR